MPDDEALWLLVTAGDDAAFEHLFRRYYPLMYRYGKKFSTDTELVKDAIQELFSELWQRRTFLNQTPSVRHYLYKSLRRKMLRLSTSQPDHGELTDELHQFNVTLSPEQLLVDEELSAQQGQQMVHWLSFLSPRQREAIYLRFYHDMEYEEIASVMTVSNHAVRNLIYEALKLLRSRLISIAINLLVAVHAQL
ncbi:RNA polymerase sigma factor [Fibrella forsythiae]|uniref:Sigma-70 family RNA polymerase sigma factor n=1 Tax=Fibrella forsythiae TaxID=2817061 RepID=A0ABS3JCJ3_9BACT|nr:sigma-70 family RNA polymerase sigma factor [Fibrella forsythiae]MBO0947707.1 sigma-70 family RNA polymerase sigma factor [Fibrella forsythiae]